MDGHAEDGEIMHPTTDLHEPIVPSSIATGWLAQEESSLADFRAVVEVETDLDDYPFATEVVQNVLLYGPEVLDVCAESSGRRQVQAEIARALHSGPGIVGFKQAFAPDVVERASDAFFAIVEQQTSAGGASGDHFASPGENDRIWNALDKLAAHDPQTFVDYYANDILAVVSEAWLGPNYQVTSQVNVVNPGGRAQVAHRDYHLGIQPAASYPAQVHAMSSFLTLQGAVAHVDMPLETGPTLYLPHSQKYSHGFLACHESAFTDYFAEHRVQLPLERGDAVFFNPALFHGAGSNETRDVRRIANLLQVSSAFGRAMEAVDTTALCKAVYPLLVERSQAGWSDRQVANVVAASAEGYPFPTNLDRDQPLHSLSPQSQAELLHEGLAAGWGQARVGLALDEQQGRRAP